MASGPDQCDKSSCLDGNNGSVYPDSPPTKESDCTIRIFDCSKLGKHHSCTHTLKASTELLAIFVLILLLFSDHIMRWH